MSITRRQFLKVGTVGIAASAISCNSVHDPAQLSLKGEDGADLWLRYPEVGDAAAEYRRQLRAILVAGSSATTDMIRDELNRGLSKMLRARYDHSALQDGTLVVGTPDSSVIVRSLSLADELQSLGPDGYLIRSATYRDHPITVIAANRDIGALYGTFHFLRLLQCGQPIERLAIRERPRLQLRLLNHWDNADGSIERGYGGRSVWRWDELPLPSPALRRHLMDYARANASIGLNGAVQNNVNADIRFLTPEYLRKVAAIATLWRPFGIRVYLAVNFAAPVTLGKLTTADPMDDAVKAWWSAVARDIYMLIPDFGGFLVKANSEGQPGPQDYGRSHAQGANVMADALAPHGGNVIWRAFVYDQAVDPDRAKRAYIEFMALDGQFRRNVLLQVKNGPIDFQPREPFHPLFGALQKAPVIAELQPTQEYTGQAKHLVYLAPMWKEFLDSDTFASGPGSTVGKYLEGDGTRVTGMAGVLNTGSDANWCGHHFSQANWYAFGRLAWDYEKSAATIADEWIRQTFTHDPGAVATISDMMLTSWETYVSYTMPLGLHHLIGGDHYAPMPWNATASRPDWTAVYYHQADADGIGFDRTRAGDKAVEQYFAPVRDVFDDVERCPEKFLLWFHHVPWGFRMKSGQTLWEQLCATYDAGARDAARLERTWTLLTPYIDGRRHHEVAMRLAIQRAHAARWRDQILGYFQKFSGRI